MGKTAEARFYTQSGCVGTEAYVHAVDGRLRFDGRPEANSGVFVSVNRFDICTQQHLGFEIGSRPDVGDDFQIDRLEGATLDTTVEVAELVTGASRQLQVQLQWTGIFDPMKSRDHRMIELPGVRLNIRESGTSRQANVGGVLSDGTVDHASGAWASGMLTSITLGSVAVSRMS